MHNCVWANSKQGETHKSSLLAKGFPQGPLSLVRERGPWAKPLASEDGHKEALIEITSSAVTVLEHIYNVTSVLPKWEWRDATQAWKCWDTEGICIVRAPS